MSGYRRCLSIRQLNTSSSLLNAVATNRTSTAPSLSPFVRSGRRVLSEDDRRRTTSHNRRTSAVNERFRQVQDERRNLIERHRDAIDSSEQKDVSSIVELIEFNSVTTKHQLQEILHHLNNNPSSFEALNDRQLSVLVQGGGVIAQGATCSFRQSYVKKLWKLLCEIKADLGILSYNARIQANIENEVEQNVVEVLEELNAAGVNADENTFSLLAKIFSLKGQTAGILNIIELLKEQNLPATQPLFESLVYSFAYNKEDEQVKTICQSLAPNPVINVPLLYVAAALAKARSTKDVNEVLKILVDIPTSVHFDRKQHLSKILEIIVALLENGVKDVVPKLRRYLYFDHARGTIPFSAFAESEVLRLFMNGNEAGALELFPILDLKNKRMLKEFFIDQLRQSLLKSPEEVVSLAEHLRNGNVFTRPLARAVEFAYDEKLPIFPFYQKFIESPEFKEFEDRSHLFYPLILNLCSQISALENHDPERQKLFTKLFDITSKSKLSYYISNKIQSTIVSEVTALVENMLHNNEFEKLRALLDDPLVNEKILVARVLPSIIRSLSRPANIPDSEIRTYAKVIASQFNENRFIGAQSVCYRIIHDLFKNKLIPEQRFSTLVRYLTEHSNVSLTKDEILPIISELRVGNHHARIELLKQLQSKPKALLRWLNSSYEVLEKEAAFLDNDSVKPGIKAQLCQIMLQKLIDDNSANNGKQILEVLKKFDSIQQDKNKWQHSVNHFVAYNTAFRRCLINGEMDVAKEILEKKVTIFDDMKLLYSLCSLNNGDDEEADKILNLIKRPPSHSILIQTIEFNVAPLTIVEKFIDLVGRKFSLDSHTRKQSTKVVKQMELRRAIDEDDLEKAFNVVSTYSSLHHEVFGQLDLMSACIKKGNKAMLTQVFEMVAERYHRNNASVDLMIAFLECGSFHSAEQVYKKAKNIFFSKKCLLFFG
uniref:Uncharacterized protein n=1 Tax=Panagrolaimus superbus TaxID=310955 RepID=A0A914Z0G7_9BILA